MYAKNPLSRSFVSDRSRASLTVRLPNKEWALGGGRFQSKIEHLAARKAAPLPKGRQKRAVPINAD